MIGATAGAHRYWTHKAFKAKTSLRISLMFCQLINYQRSLKTWVRDHKIHHKYSDTVKDPHNPQRGFFFAHVGWIFMPKSPELLQEEKKIDISDLENDSVVMFQYKYYELLVLIAIALSTLIPMFFWNETFHHAYFVVTSFRLLLSLHITWSINSFNHLYGYKPYDSTIKPSQNALVSFLSHGEGGHNFHHVFPFDYRSDELRGFGSYFVNSTTAFIELCARLGLAYDLKFASPELIKRQKLSKGMK
jgi:stearoyl-CoA desaturase (Delta-9 desaturase)